LNESISKLLETNDVERIFNEINITKKSSEVTFDILKILYLIKNINDCIEFLNIEFYNVAELEKASDLFITGERILKEIPQLNINFETELTIEPFLGLDYCWTTLSGMYTLSGSIFAKQYHTYSDLSNVMREDPSNVSKVKIAVSRLASIANYAKICKNNHTEYGNLKKIDENREQLIYCDDKVWEMNSGDDESFEVFNKTLRNDVKDWI